VAFDVLSVAFDVLSVAFDVLSVAFDVLSWKFKGLEDYCSRICYDAKHRQITYNMICGCLAFTLELAI